jgi:hypothetical protein
MVHTTLRHPDLRLRDIKHIVALKRFDIHWDRGTVPESEWVYASLEDYAHRERLLAWLRGKNVSESAEAFVLGGGYNDWTSVTWGEILAHPEKFFDDRPRKIVSKDLDWRLDYRKECVARFGRWHYSEPSNQSLQPTGGRRGKLP